MLHKRAGGILLHPTSLPSPHGIGDLGPDAYHFVDFLRTAGQTCWQILPLNATDAGAWFSPYTTRSAFAANHLLISPHALYQAGLLSHDEIDSPPAFPAATIDYDLVLQHKLPLLHAAHQRFRQQPLPDDYLRFLDENAYWLDDYILFDALKHRHPYDPWRNWPDPLRDREPHALHEARQELADHLEFHRFLQFTFHQQFHALKAYANEHGVHLFGDMPIYPALECADVWAHPHLFQLDQEKKPTAVAGVPPDYFSATGQLWGNPLYDWPKHQETAFDWWLRRFEHNFRLFDLLRIDHFRGLVAYWQVPASDNTAINGQWIEAPHRDFFNAVFFRFPNAPLIAEDLGEITPDVREVVENLSLPGMKVLQFSFDGDPADNPHCLHNHRPNAVVYPGTHDNNTARGWFSNETSPHLFPNRRRNLTTILGHAPSPATIAWDLTRLAFMSVCNLAIVPMPDLLNLDHRARMNTPASGEGAGAGADKRNWRWRMKPDQATPALARKLLRLTQLTART